MQYTRDKLTRQVVAWNEPQCVTVHRLYCRNHPENKNVTYSLHQLYGHATSMCTADNISEFIAIM